MTCYKKSYEDIETIKMTEQGELGADYHLMICTICSAFHVISGALNAD